MVRTLPKIDLKGDKFYVQLSQGGLMNDHSPYNFILFKDMDFFDAQFQPYLERPELQYPLYQFFYSTATRTLYKPEHGQQQLPEDIVRLEILHESFLDPEGYAGLHHVPLHSSWLPVGRHYHLAHELKRVNLEGHPFFIDTLNKRFSHGLEAAKDIPFGRVALGSHYMYIPFDTLAATGLPAGASLHDINTNERIKIITLPHLRDIDLVGWHRMQGYPSGLFKDYDPKRSVKQKHVAPFKKAEENRIR